MIVSNASVLISKTKGYIIKLNDTQLWTSKLISNYVCGHNGRFVFTNSPDFRTIIISDPLGTFLVFVIGILISIVVTATWPLLVSISMKIGKVSDKVTGVENNIISYIKKNIVDKMSEKEEESVDEVDEESINEKKRKKKKNSLNIFTIVWMSIAAVILLFVSVLVSQLLCYNMRWRNLYKKKIINECYELNFENEKNKLSNENASFSNGNNVDLKYFRENDTAIFTLKAQVGTYYSDNGNVIYDFNPTTTKFICKKIPKVRIEDIYVGNKKSANSCYDNKPDTSENNCVGDFFEYEDYNWEYVKDDERIKNDNSITILAYDTKYHDKYKQIYDKYDVPSADVTLGLFRKIFMNAPSSSFGENGEWCSQEGCMRTKAKLTYSISYWSLCTKDELDSDIVARRTENSKAEMLDIKGFSHLINSKYPYGYYDLDVTSSGFYMENGGNSMSRIIRKNDKEIDTISNYLVFNKGEVDENYIISHFLKNAIEYDCGRIEGWVCYGDYDYFDDKFNISRNDFVTYTLHNASRFSDFTQPCKRVHAYDEVIDNITHVYIQSDDSVTCYLEVGWDNGESQMIIISPGGIQDVTGAITWSCITNNDNKAVGINCEQNYKSLFETPLQNLTIGVLPNISVTNNNNDNKASGKSGTSMTNRDGGIVNGKITTKKILTYIGIGIGCLFGVIIIIVIIVKIVKRRKKKDN